jgi:hypothetical protein
MIDISNLEFSYPTGNFFLNIPELISMEASDRVAETDLSLPIPMYVRFKARGHPIAGTTLDYFEFRGLKIDQGRQFAVLGDCILGAKVAKSLALKPGDSLISSPESLFDLAGVYPLKMKVAGVLKKSHTSDDLAVFVDLKTAWVIPKDEQWLEFKKILKHHPAKWMIWEGDPLKNTIQKLRGLQIDSIVFNPCGNVPAEGDFVTVMRKNIENLKIAFEH